METQYTRLSMTPSGVPPVIYMSQNDIGRPIGFVCDADLSNYAVVLEATRTDGTPITVAVTVDGNICAFETTATMTNKADVYIAQIVVTNASGKHISSIPIKCVVVLAAMDENSEGIEEDAPLYQQYTGTVQSLIADIRTQLNAETAARQAAVSAEASARQAAVSAEASARQAADNTLQSNINAEASTRATQDASLQSQINQLVAPTGEAPSAAEVQNARVGADGTVYPTLGDAIRTQVTDVKSAFQREQANTFTVPTTYIFIANAQYWTIGVGVRPSTGENQTTDKQCRTPYNTIKGRTLLYIDNPNYNFVVWEYTTDSVGSAVYSPFPAWGSDPVIIAEDMGATKFRVGVNRKDGGIITEADVEILTTAVKTFLLTDKTLEIKGSPADSKTVGDNITEIKAKAENDIKCSLLSMADHALWEIGSFNSSTGTEYPSETSNRMRTKAKTQHFYSVKTTDNYLFGVYAWDEGGTYIGTLQNDGTYSKTVPYYLSEIVFDPTNGYSYRLLLKKADNSAFEDTAAGDDVIIATSLPYKNKQDIEEIRQEIAPIQGILPKPFPADGKKPDAVSFYESFDEVADWQTVTGNQLYEYGVVSGGYVDEHITDYQNYELRAYFLNGRMEYIGYNGEGQTPSTNYYKLLSPYTDDPNAEAAGTSLYHRKKVLITAGMHGDEGATPNILREFVRELINNPEYTDILTGYQFCFIPLANPYGYSIDRRHCRYYDSETGQIETKDMNGDFPQDGTGQVLNESKFIKQIFLDGEYDIVIDLHQHNFDTDSGTTTNKLAFGGITLKPQSTIDAEKYYRAISGESIHAQNMIRSVFDIEDNAQTMFAWDRDTTHTNTFREYAVGTRDTSARHKAEMAAISETSTCCFIYSNTHTKYNQLAMTVCKEYDTAFIAGILRKFIEE